MKARVKAQDHINLDAVGIGTASIIVRALKLLVEYEAGNEVTAGLGVTAYIEIEAAIEEAEAMKLGVAKELRKKRREEVKAEAKVITSEIPESLVVSEHDKDVMDPRDNPEDMDYGMSTEDNSDTTVNHAVSNDRCG